MDRIMVFNRLDAYLCDLDPKKVHGLRSVEEVNGEHALTITTTHQLEKTNRIVLKDGMGHWHEYVVTGIVGTHETDQGVVTEYYCVWSIQYDLSGTFVDNQYGCGIVPGHASVPHPVQDALTIALSTTNRWQIGTVSVTSMTAASFYRRSGWEAIQTVIEKWGGELQTTIVVGPDGVAERYADLLEHVGASNATRRFDYGHDVANIKRTVSDEVWPCRIIPLGASQETDEGGYTRRPTIESVNSGVMWLEDAEAAPLTRVPDGNGGWEYPTVIVENDTYEEPADLKAWALANITDYTRPKVTYEASVVQLARAGMNPHGVALGDEVVVVDREFGGDGLRITARVVRQECNLLDPTDTVLTIGNITDKLSGQLADLSRQVSEVAEQVANASSYQSSTEYVSRLLGRINNEANATGGFTYITEGQGIRTYDVAVTDPLVGTEASSVVEVKGGTIRIANTKTAQGQWEWKTIFTSGYVNAEVIRAIGLLASSHVEVDAYGVHIYDQNGTEVALYAPTVRIGAASSGAFLTIGSDSLDMLHGATEMLHFGYGDGAAQSGTANAPYYTIGTRAANTAVGNYSVAEGYRSTASGYTSHAEGHRTGATGSGSHAEGWDATASGDGSHAEGDSTTASGDRSHAEGYYAMARGENSHAEGYYTIASGENSHAEGYYTVASGDRSFAGGTHTLAASANQAAFGEYNANSSSNAFEVGNGYSSHRSNAFAVDWDGNVEHYGDVPWTNLQLASSVVAYSDGQTPRYRKWGPVVQVIGAVKLESSQSEGFTASIGTLPYGCRPSRQISAVCQGSGNNTWLCIITTDGNMSIERYRNGGTSAAATTSTWFPFSITFLTA